MPLQRPSNQILRLILSLTIVSLTFSDAAAKPIVSNGVCIELTCSRFDPVFDQWSPARRLRYGYGMTANPSHALEWYLKAARAGDTRAKHNVGIMLVLGLGVERDVARGIAWLDESFAAGSVESALALGELSRQGVGQPEDLDRAVLLYRFAAEAGDVRAWHALGNLALRGKGPSPGEVSAFSWYRCAAQKGHLPSVAAMDAMKRKLGWHETLRAISTVCPPVRRAFPH